MTAPTASIYDLFTKRQPPTPDATPVVPMIGAEGTRYAQAALQREASLVASAPEGTRNDSLNRAAFSLSQLIAAGHLPAQTVWDTLTMAARAAGLDDREVEVTLKSGWRGGTVKPRTNVPDPAEDNDDWAPAVTTIDDQRPPGPPPGQAPARPTPAEEDRAEALRLWREQTLAQEVERIRIRREAERFVTAEEEAKSWREPPWRPTLTEELAIPDQPQSYLVDDIFPTGGNVLLTAQYKAGKTHTVNSLTKALADDEQFLGRFDTHLERGRVALWNYEVDDNQYRRWLREMDIRNTDQVAVLNLRGYRMPVMVPSVEDWIVNWLTDRDVSVWVVDPFARAFVGSGTSENDNTEVGAFLDTLDVIKERAGVSELILPTHTGRGEMEKGEERARGATRLDDWADVRWILTKDDQDVRFLRATGRDVDFPEERLNYDEATRHLTLGGGDRAWEQRRRRVDAVVQVVDAHPGIGLAALRTAVREAGVKGRNDAIDAAINEAEYAARIIVEKGGSGAATRHFPARTTVIGKAVGQ